MNHLVKNPSQSHTQSEITPRIGITVGDVNGIGPEVIIKALSDNRILNRFTPIIYGSSRVLSYYKKVIKLDDWNYVQVKTKGQFTPKQINVVNCWEDTLEVTPGIPSKEGGNAALLSLQKASEELKEGLLEALVTGPINKQLIHGESFPFKGHTEFLTDYFQANESLMFLVSESLRVALVTEHVPVHDVPAMITKERIEIKINLMEQSLRNDFNISKPRIAILGLNPHAGDNGLIGKEEQEVIEPLISEFKNKGKLVWGPFSADGFFASGQYKKYDGTLAMYHDQGLIPFKLATFETGVNYTAGLPIVRTSPDHGTAYSLAGKGIASEQSFREALYTACAISQNRKEVGLKKIVYKI